VTSHKRSDGCFDDETQRAATIPGSRSYDLVSKAIGQTYLIDVAMPPVAKAATEHLPVVYVLDANGTFGIAAQTARLLQMGPYPLPPMLVVGIGYPANEASRLPGLRTRDLSPSVDKNYLARFRAAPAPWTLPPDIEPGGAEVFLNFIEHELKPFIAARYSVNPQDQTLIGMSLGGLFALYTLFYRPFAFNRYVAASPALWWDNRMLFKAEAELAARVQDLPANLFLSVGGLEEAHDAPSRMISNLYELDATLRQRRYPNLKVGFQVFPDETHMSVFPAALSRGLTAVFGGHGEVADWSRRLS